MQQPSDTSMKTTTVMTLSDLVGLKSFIDWKQGNHAGENLRKLEMNNRAPETSSICYCLKFIKMNIFSGMNFYRWFAVKLVSLFPCLFKFDVVVVTARFLTTTTKWFEDFLYTHMAVKSSDLLFMRIALKASSWMIIRRAWFFGPIYV